MSDSLVGYELDELSRSVCERRVHCLFSAHVIDVRPGRCGLSIAPGPALAAAPAPIISNTPAGHALAAWLDAHATRESRAREQWRYVS
jgi:hypothetical protein